MDGIEQKELLANEKQKKWKIAIEEYKNRPTYNFMKSANENYWTFNQKIIQSYSRYYESQRQPRYGSQNQKFSSVPNRKGANYMKNNCKSITVRILNNYL